MALAYHDIALRTDGVLNYLEPSASRLEERVTQEIMTRQAEGDEVMAGPIPTRKCASLVGLLGSRCGHKPRPIILQHHKFTNHDVRTDEEVYPSICR